MRVPETGLFFLKRENKINEQKVRVAHQNWVDCRTKDSGINELAPIVKDDK